MKSSCRIRQYVLRGAGCQKWNDDDGDHVQPPDFVIEVWRATIAPARPNLFRSMKRTASFRSQMAWNGKAPEATLHMKDAGGEYDESDIITCTNSDRSIVLTLVTSSSSSSTSSPTSSSPSSSSCSSASGSPSTSSASCRPSASGATA
ncbi:hypothetical protein KC357_g47 [Hortaea werneckii]|nr:hypothetical protein KC357_g47 [Hortaea werneckii]